MKLKRIIAVLVALMMSTAFMQSVSAERVKFSAPEVLSESGMTTVTYTLSQLPAGKSATLVALYIDSETGNILSVNAASYDDVSEISDGKITISLPDKSGDGGVLKHYLLKDTKTVIPLDDVAPGAVSSITVAADASKPSSKINLSWTAPADDWDASEDLRYNVYDMGILLDENVSSTSFSAENLNWGSKFAFEIEAADTSGNISDKSYGSVVETIYPNSILTTDTVTSTDSNLIFTSNAWQEAADTPGSAAWYFCYENAVMDGLPCVGTSVRKGQGTYHSVKMSDKLLSDLEGDGEFIFEIEYLSIGNTQMTLELYTSESGAEKQETKRLNVINDSKWHTLTEKITMANDFQAEGRKNHNYSHFRFVGGNNTATSVEPFYIKRITIMPVDEYNALNYERDAYLDVQASTVPNGLGIESEVTPVLVDGFYGIEANGLTVSAASNVTTGDATGIEVIYYAPEGTESFTINGETVTVTKTEKWQKAKISLDGGLAGASFVIDGGVYINNIRLANGLPAIS